MTLRLLFELHLTKKKIQNPNKPKPLICTFDRSKIFGTYPKRAIKRFMSSERYDFTTSVAHG